MDEIKLVKYLSGELSGTELIEVERWLGTPENKAEFEKIQQIWENAAELENTDLFDAGRSWAGLKQRMDSLHMKSVRERNISYRKYAVAASLLIIFGLAAIFFILGNKNRNLIQYTAGNVKLEKPYTLPDGSTVYLNRNTNLSFSNDFNKKTRTVSLTGEAFFDVAKNSEIPFIIRTATAEIRVVGTSFNVMAYSHCDSVQVSVQSGIVEMYSKTDKDSRITLAVGNEGTFIKSHRKLVNKKTFDSNSISWKTGQLNFQSADMKYVASVLEHTFGKQIRINSENLKNCRLTVDFNNQSLDTILKVIKVTFGLTITNEDGNYTLSGPGC